VKSSAHWSSRALWIIYLAFYDDVLTYRFAKVVEQDRHQWQNQDELVDEANSHWDQLPQKQRDFDRAKAEFVRRFV
jgi:hypothetical protein